MLSYILCTMIFLKQFFGYSQKHTSVTMDYKPDGKVLVNTGKPVKVLLKEMHGFDTIM